MLHGAHPRPQPSHLLERGALEADHDGLVVELRERAADEVVPAVAAGRLQLGHDPDPAAADLEHLLERRQAVPPRARRA